MSSLLNVLLRNGYRVAYQDLNFSMGLDFEDMDAYISLLPANGRKNLKCALNENLQLRRCEEIQEKKRAYEIIRENRTWKGYPLRMAWEQVEETIAIVPHDFYIVSKDNQAVAAAMIYRVAEDAAQVIYWGDVPGVAPLRPMNYLAYRLAEHYKHIGMRHLDIGPSTEAGIPNYGLCDFKSSIGCCIQPKFTLEKDL